jgi:hypothetical protein
VIESVLQSINLVEPDTLDAVQRLDADAREAATNCVTLMATPKTQS